MNTPGRRRSALVALVAQAALIIAACGGGSDSNGGGTTAAQQPQGDGRVRLEKIGDFDQPVYVTQPPGSDDLYVVEREGSVRIVRDGKVVSRPALDITDQVTSDGTEQGFLSVAFAPDFQSSRDVYAYYTGNDQDQHVVGFKVADDGSFDAGSEREILHMDDFVSNHNGGLLLFGPDGQLYIGTGDGGTGEDPNGQNLDSLLGKILRIDPRPTSTAATNTAAEQRPYTVESPGPLGQGARPEICDYGLRNPWRFSFDRGTAALLIGDVGQSTQEEIDYVPAERPAATTSVGPPSRGQTASTRTRVPRTRYPRFSPTAATRAARSPAATWSGIARCRRCSAATSTATSAPVSCAASSRRPHGPAMTARSV